MMMMRRMVLAGLGEVLRVLLVVRRVVLRLLEDGRVLPRHRSVRGVGDETRGIRSPKSDLLSD